MVVAVISTQSCARPLRGSVAQRPRRDRLAATASAGVPVGASRCHGNGFQVPMCAPRSAVSDFLAHPQLGCAPLAVADLVARAGQYTDISFRDGQVQTGDFLLATGVYQMTR